MIHIPQYTDRRNRTLQRIVDMITAAESRMEACYKRVRKHDRKPFQGPVLICLPTANHPSPSEDHPTTFPAWAYSISPGGIGFLAPENISLKQIIVGLKLPNGTIRWLPSDIVRSRPIPGEEFFDYGVSFRRDEAPVAEPTLQAAAAAE